MTKISPLKRQSKIFIFNLLIVLSSLFIAEAAYLQGWFLTLENMFHDSCQRYNGVESDYSPHVVIVKIDRKTMQKYNDLPMAFWGPYFAEALSRLRLCKVRAIGLDMIFTVSPEDCLLKLGVKSTNLVRAYDVDFRSQLNMGEIILAGKAVMTKTGPGKIILPTDDYLYALHDASASIGLANFVQDTDGVIRSYIPRLFSGNSTPNLSFAALLMIKAGITIPDQGLSRIIFIGPPGSVPRLSFLDLLKADKKQFAAIKTLLRNKLVIISVEDNGFDDFHLTPYATGLSISKEIKLMSGAELHANIIETMISDRQFRQLGIFPHAVWLLMIMTIALIFFRRLTPGKGFLALAFLILLSAILSLKLFMLFILAPIIPTAAALSCSYIGVLGLRLTNEEREHRHLLKVFTPYLSESILKNLINRQELPFLGGEEREITALFSDIRNFTTISEKLAPEEVVEMLNRYYGLICEEIIACGGLIDKFVGDAVMVIFGAPMHSDNHAEMALKAALTIVTTANDFQEWLTNRFPDRGIPAFTVAVGINTGKALVGNVGSERRMGYTAIGDTVNIASRLEDASKALGWSIVASAVTIESGAHCVQLGRSDRIRPKGRSGRVEVFEVLAYTKGESTDDATR